MRVFVTGATGFIGSALVPELIANGHQVIGLARSDEGAAALKAAGAEVQRGTIEDLDGLKAVAARADGVVHLAFNHDFARYLQNCEDDRRVIEAMSDVLAGSDRPMLVTSGTLMAVAAPGRPALEEGPVLTSAETPRAASEEAATAATARGANVGVVRLPQVHDTRRQGLVSYAIQVALQTRVSAYAGEGRTGWAAAHVSDVARLYRLALEKAEPGARYHAVGEESVSFRDIAEALGRRLGLPVRSIPPEEAGSHFGFLGAFMGRDGAASSAWTQARLGWTPAGRGLIADLEELELEVA